MLVISHPLYSLDIEVFVIAEFSWKKKKIYHESFVKTELKGVISWYGVIAYTQATLFR